MTDKTHFEQRVRERAYYLWQQAGAPHGRDHDFWHQAHEEERRAGGVAEPAPSLQASPATETASSSEPHSSKPTKPARAGAMKQPAPKRAASAKPASTNVTDAPRKAAAKAPARKESAGDAASKGTSTAASRASRKAAKSPSIGTGPASDA